MHETTGLILKFLEEHAMLLLSDLGNSDILMGENGTAKIA